MKYFQLWYFDFHSPFIWLLFFLVFISDFDHFFNFSTEYSWRAIENNK
jgi:hypothetical protein